MMALTTWAVLFQPSGATSYKVICKIAHEFSSDDTLRNVIDSITNHPRVINFLAINHKKVINFYEIFELPELPVVEPPTEDQLSKVYEERITDAYLRQCPVRDRRMTVGQISKPDNLVLIVYAIADRAASVPQPNRNLSPIAEQDGPQSERAMIASAGNKCKAPSSDAMLDQLRTTQTSTCLAAVHNGRPVNLTGMSPSIYHPAFATFLHTMCDQQPFTSEELLAARRCVQACAEYYGTEKMRVKGLTKAGLDDEVHADLLCQMVYELASGTIKPEGSLRAQVRGHSLKPLFCIVEVKNEVGMGGCDPIAQAEQCYRAYYCSDEARVYYDMSSCPCLLVGIAGPNIMVSGAVIGDYILAQPLTDYISLIPRFTLDEQSPHSSAIRRMAQVLRALRVTTAELEQFYLHLDLAPPAAITTPPTSGRTSRVSRGSQQQARTSAQLPTSAQRRPYIGPHFTVFTARNGALVTLKYTGRLLPKERRKAIFTAVAHTEAKPPTAVVVKFAHTYSAAAHALLASRALAPTLWFCEKVRSVGMYVVVMDYLHDTEDAYDKTLTAAQHASLRGAIKLLHDDGLVFGDLRGPNVLLPEGGVKLVDFEWCGKEGEARYPGDINMDATIGWHPEVFPGGLITKEHDMHLLKALGDGENGN